MRAGLVNDPDAVSVLAERVARDRQIPAAHVEKDFWVTEVLRGVVDAAAETGIEVWFKGGTSLSKVYSMIERFSEDVDVLVVIPKGSASEQDRLLKGLIEGACKATNLASTVEAASATKGVKRSARFHYRDVGVDSFGISQGVLLELGTRGGALGANRVEVRSYIAEHVREIADEPEAAPVEVRVLAPWRTLVEKLVLLHTAHTSSNPSAAVRGARHFYDVHQLLTRPEVRSGIVEAGIGALARDVLTYSHAADLPAEERPKGGFSTSPAFNGGPHIDVVAAEYTNRVVGQLLWPGRKQPSLKDCIDIVRVHADIL